MIGPVVPSHLMSSFFSGKGEEEDDEEDAGFGPMPSEHEIPASVAAAAEIEGRAGRMKNRLLGNNDEDNLTEAKRESWMLDLPPELTPNFGVTARTFRTKAPPKDVDRSGWTETPADREKRLQDELLGISSHKKVESLPDRVQVAKDSLYAEQVAEYNNTVRAKSLLELHTAKLHKSSAKKSKKSKSKKKSKHKHKSKSDDDDDGETSKKHHHHKKKKKEKKETVASRRPFDRDVDLQVNRLDAAKRNSFVNKAQQLGGRFGHGSAQFL